MQSNLLIDFGKIFSDLWGSMGLAQGGWQNYVMLLISFVLMYLAIVKKFEPMLLLPIAFGMFLINLPGKNSLGRLSRRYLVKTGDRGRRRERGRVYG